MLPMSGRKIKIYYRGIQKLCTNCFGRHQKRNCHSRKVLWIDYVAQFVAENPDIPDEYYGKWVEIIKKTETEKNPIQDREKGFNAERSERERPAINLSTAIDPFKQTAPVEVHHVPGNEVPKKRITLTRSRHSLQRLKRLQIPNHQTQLKTRTQKTQANHPVPRTLTSLKIKKSTTLWSKE